MWWSPNLYVLGINFKSRPGLRLNVLVKFPETQGNYSISLIKWSSIRSLTGIRFILGMI